MALDLDRTTFEPSYGCAVAVAAGVSRITARNPNPFSSYGTNSYLVGNGTLAVIDPGPDDAEHLETLLQAIDGRPVSHILVTHTHIDHSPLARRLSMATGALTAGAGPHLEADGTRPRSSTSGDLDFHPDIVLHDGGRLDGDGWAFQAIHTPGHAANHVVYDLSGTGILFSGDHVMGWSTTVVAPPEGSMGDYMNSLDKLAGLDHRLYLPGHGGPIIDPIPFVRALKTHRVQREQSILNLLRTGGRSIDDLVGTLYRTTRAELRPAAGMTILAHLQHLMSRGIVVANGEGGMGDVFELAAS